MKIVVLDAQTISSNDLNWDELSLLGDLKIYNKSSNEEAMNRIEDADAVFFSKIQMDGNMIKAHPSIKFLGVTATGVDNLDIITAKENGIACCNVPSYSTDAVAQHAIALLLEATNHVGIHSFGIKEKGEWNIENGFCYWKSPLVLLKGKSIGIIGYGNIGKRVAEIAKALGMEINIYSKTPEKALASDFVSLHMPANNQTLDFINKESISLMKDGAVLINTARGALVDEMALATALKSGKISTYATDVLAEEPPNPDNPLLSLPQCIVTPHNAWTPLEMRATVCKTCADNLKSWLEGGTLNRVDL